MSEFIDHSPFLAERRRGIALLMVLLIVVAITILATGFLAGADSELACGVNTLLRMQMDQLAASGLEHGRGLVLHPQEVPSEFWTDGATAQQLVEDSPDRYDVWVARDVNRPDGHCTYDVKCKAYRLRGSERTGQSGLAAQLRLDPCIGLWTNGDINFRRDWALQGDLRSGGRVVSSAARTSINGDIFSANPNPPVVVGQHSDAGQLSLVWPPVTRTYTNPHYNPGVLVSPVPSGTWQPAIWHCTGDLVLTGNVAIQGMLLVEGNLTIQGDGNRIVADGNLPALYVSGDLVIESVNGLEIDGLAVVDRDVRISAAASNVVVVGAMFVGGTLLETTTDVAGNYPGRVRGNPTWTAGKLGRALQLNDTGDYVDCGADPAFDITGAITVAAWVNTTDAGDNQQHPYVTKGDHAYALKHRYVAGDSGSSIEFFIYDSATWQSARSAVDPNFNNAWHHVAGTYDGSKLRLYIDGVLKAEPNATGPIESHPKQPLCIGANCEWPDRSYHGAIDDVRIYNRSLSEAEIRHIASITSGLVAHWKLDEAGSVLKVVVDPMQAAILTWESGAPQGWSPAAGGFFRKIRRW